MKKKLLLISLVLIAILATVYAVITLTVNISPSIAYNNNTLTGSCSQSGLNGSVFYDYRWYKNSSLYINNIWSSDSSYVTGLGDIGYNSAPTVFYNLKGDGKWGLIAGEGDGIFNGYHWNGTRWISDSSYVTGLGDIGYNSAPTVFYNLKGDGKWGLIAGESDGVFNGYYWNGTRWISNSSYIYGIADTTGGDIGDESNLFLFYNLKNNSKWALIACSYYDTTCLSNEWNGTKWISDSSYVTGLSTIYKKKPQVIYNLNNNNKWILVHGNYLGTFNGYYWNGTRWISDSSYVTGLSDIGSSSAPTVFYNLKGDGKWGLIAGEEDGTFNGFKYSTSLTQSPLSIKDTWKFSCRAYNSTTNSSWTNSTEITIQDNPTTRTVSTNAVVYSNETLKGYCNVTDSTKSNLKFYYKWYKNSVLNESGNVNATQGILNNIDNVTGLTAKDIWKFSCLASDGTRNSTWTNSSTVTIKALPIMQTSIITPTISYKNNTLRGYCNATDGDTTSLKIYYRWYKNSILNESGTKNITQNTNINIANKTGLTKTEQWIFSCQAQDEKYNSSRLNSSIKTISNWIPTVPVLTNPTNNYVLPRDNTTLTWSASTEIDADTVTYYLYVGLTNTTLVLNYTGTNTSHMIDNLLDLQNYYWRVKAGDGTSNSSNSSIYRFYTSYTNPAINIITPLNATWSKNNNNNFSYIATDSDGIDTCKFYFYNSTGTYIQTNSSVISGTTDNFTQLLNYEVPFTTYKWSIWCNDTVGLESTTGNQTLYFDNVAPSVILSSPTPNQVYNSESINVLIQVTESNLYICNYVLKFKNTSIISSLGALNCSGDNVQKLTTLSTPYSSQGYTLTITVADYVNTVTIERNFTTTAPVTPPSGGGGGGAIVIDNKKSCNIELKPDAIAFTSQGTAEIKVTNKDSISYAPSIKIDVKDIPTNHLEITNALPAILPTKVASFGIKYVGTNGDEGTFTVTLTDLNCKDIVVDGVVGKNLPQEDIFDTILSAGIIGFLLSSISQNISFIRVWMLLIGMIIIIAGLSSTILTKALSEGKIATIIIWAIMVLGSAFLLTVPLVNMIRG